MLSFTFKWPQFSEDFLRDARAMLEAALNKGSKPPVIADKIEVVELEMGSQPPELDIREIGELTLEQFRGIFRLSYAGDAHIVLRTKVQVIRKLLPRDALLLMAIFSFLQGESLKSQKNGHPRLKWIWGNACSPSTTSCPHASTFVSFHIEWICGPSRIKTKGTFDSIAVIQKYIQREIEGQLREMFREDLPGIIHRLSQRWIAGRTRIDTPYLTKQRIKIVSEHADASSYPFLVDERILPSYPSNSSTSHTASELSSRSLDKQDQDSSRTDFTTSVNDYPVTFPHLEDSDVPYGLRLDDLPSRSSYSGFKKLFAPSKGLRDLTEESNEDGVEWQESSTLEALDTVSWDETSSLRSSTPSEDIAEFETLPAIGGGMVTRPRIYYSQSGRLSHSASTSRGSPRTGRGTLPPSLSRNAEATFPGNNTIRPQGAGSLLNTEPADVLAQKRKDFLDKFARLHFNASSENVSASGSEMYDGRSTYTDIASPIELQEDSHYHKLNLLQNPTIRPRSFSTSTRRSDNINVGSPPKFISITDNDGKNHIVLRPGMSGSISHLSSLSHSNHTMSPFTRSFEHFTVRSVPHKPPHSTTGQPMKARRRRIYRLKTAEVPAVNEEEQRTNSPSPPSDFEASDIEHYFQNPPFSVRRRPSYQEL
ncbi:hypothetical protein Clacol_001479 [Clathrus columnatus]|uniref:SMP-LTD domain-containing protein n=1 Tax=Clathrus columnatus TaxID=1419009 RepID=A0AAV5A1W3_9AGAM|nr:hypothetical protein Clacol_001479 [Clathrus columnatus]